VLHNTWQEEYIIAENNGKMGELEWKGMNTFPTWYRGGGSSDEQVNRTGRDWKNHTSRQQGEKGITKWGVVELDGRGSGRA